MRLSKMTSLLMHCVTGVKVRPGPGQVGQSPSSQGTGRASIPWGSGCWGQNQGLEGHSHVPAGGEGTKGASRPHPLTLSRSHLNETQTLVLSLRALLPRIHAPFFP